jgi:hypothetical protein
MVNGPTQKQEILLAWIEFLGFCTSQQLFLAIRQTKRRRDVALYRLLAKMVDLGVIRRFADPVGRYVYFLPSPKRRKTTYAHGVGLSWIKIYLSLSSEAMGYRYGWVTDVPKDLGSIPDALLIFEKEVTRGDGVWVRRVVAIEYQRSKMREDRLLKKLRDYKDYESEILGRFGARFLYVLCVFRTDGIAYSQRWLKGLKDRLGANAIYYITSEKLFLETPPAGVWHTRLWYQPGGGDLCSIFD